MKDEGKQISPSAFILAFQRRPVNSDVRCDALCQNRGGSDRIKESTWDVRSVPSAVADGLKSRLEFSRNGWFCRPLRGLGTPRRVIPGLRSLRSLTLG